MNSTIVSGTSVSAEECEMRSRKRNKVSHLLGRSATQMSQQDSRGGYGERTLTNLSTQPACAFATSSQQRIRSSARYILEVYCESSAPTQEGMSRTHEYICVISSQRLSLEIGSERTHSERVVLQRDIPVCRERSRCNIESGYAAR